MAAIGGSGANPANQQFFEVQEHPTNSREYQVVSAKTGQPLKFSSNLAGMSFERAERICQEFKSLAQGAAKSTTTLP
ncbi:MAG: hypothetical protein JSR37_02865, partial [Verrucomicrobia bacterium]|nr:hypothetical protein [Verrucomicrobiota bacterium]